ncbi:MAG: hypothetical protein ACI9D0_001410 [Bacteroidia bacterium]|jgi:hypothetical protein
MNDPTLNVNVPEQVVVKRRRFLRTTLIFGAVVFGVTSGWTRGITDMAPQMRGEGIAVKVNPNEHAVRLGVWDGELAAVEGSGYQMTLPGVAEVFRFSKASQTLVMEQKEGQVPTGLGRLRVRSRDGSAFFFESVELEYRVTEMGAVDFLRSSAGQMERAEAWVMAISRPVLRDEFGRYSVQEVMDAVVCDEARAKSFVALNEQLSAFGIEVLQLNMGKPNFDRTYELAINQRKVADQEVERLGEELLQKVREQEQQLVKANKEVEVRGKMLEAELERELVEAVTSTLTMRGSAESYAVTRKFAGEVTKAKLEVQATSLAESGRAKAQAFVAELSALEGRGEIAIREQLVANLSKVIFKLTPFTSDPDPDRIDRVTLPLSKAGL